MRTTKLSALIFTVLFCPSLWATAALELSLEERVVRIEKLLGISSLPNEPYAHDEDSPIPKIYIYDSATAHLGSQLKEEAFSTFLRLPDALYFFRVALDKNSIASGVQSEVNAKGVNIEIAKLLQGKPTKQKLIGLKLVGQLGVGLSSETITWGPTFDMEVAPIDR